MLNIVMHSLLPYCSIMLALALMTLACVQCMCVCVFKVFYPSVLNTCVAIVCVAEYYYTHTHKLHYADYTTLYKHTHVPTHMYTLRST